MNVAPMLDKTFTDAQKSSSAEPSDSNQQYYRLQPSPFNLALLALPQVNKSEVTAKDHIILLFPRLSKQKNSPMT